MHRNNIYLIPQDCIVKIIEEYVSFACEAFLRISDVDETPTIWNYVVVVGHSQVQLIQARA